MILYLILSETPVSEEISE